MNSYPGVAPPPRALPMPEIIVEPPTLPCYFPASGSGIEQYQSLDPDFFYFSVTGTGIGRYQSLDPDLFPPRARVRPAKARSGRADAPV
jgi:hypothetical protein